MRQLKFLSMVIIMMTPARKEPDLKTYAGRFAARLRELRTNAKLTPEQVAETLGVAKSAVYFWEAGRNFPQIAKFEELAKLYKLKKIKDLLPDE